MSKESELKQVYDSCYALKSKVYPDLPLKTRFKLGDTFIIKDTTHTIVDVIDNGKVYKIHSYKLNESNENKIIIEYTYYIRWDKLLDEYYKQSEEFRIKTRDEIYTKAKFNLNYGQRCLSDLHSKLFYFGIDMNPEYQRELVWKKKQKIEFIKAIFDERIDLGKMVFLDQKFNIEKPTHIILDGKQRLNTILEFYLNKIPLIKNGKEYYYTDHKDAIDIVFFHRTISVAIVTEEVTTEDILELFLAINNTGTPMSKKDISKVELQLKNYREAKVKK